MKSKRFMGIVVLVVCAVLGVAFTASAVELRYNESDQKWRDLEVQRVPWRSGNDLDNDYYGTNCFAFVKWVVEDEGRGTITQYGNYGRVLVSQTGGTQIAQHLNERDGTPTAAKVKAEFQKAKAGDVVQMRWRYSSTTQHTALINGFGDNGVYFFQSHVSGTNVMKIKNSYYSYADLAQRYANPGTYGGFTIYSFGNTPAPTITDTPSEAAVAGVNYSYQCKADGDVSSWSTEGTLPPGLYIDSSTGEIKGEPSSTASGLYAYMAKSYKFKVKATNAGGTAERSASISIYEPPNITTNSLQDGKTGKSYSQEINASGTEFTMNWKIISGKIPPGLKFDGSRNTRKATISGTPTTPGTYYFMVRLYNLVGNPDTTTTKIYRIKIGEPTPESNMWINGTFKEGQIGAGYSSSIKLYFNSSMYLSRWMAGANVSVIDGELPPGLSLRWTTLSGIDSYMWANISLYGTPTKAGTYTFTLRALNGYGGYTESMQTINVPQRSVSFADPSMYIVFTFLKGKLGVSYNDYVAVYGGSSPYTVSATSTSGIMPPGLSLSVKGRYIHLSGIPTRYGTFTFTLRAKGSHNGYVDKTFRMTIDRNTAYAAGQGADDGTPAKPELLTDRLPNAIIGSTYSATLEASGTKPITWSYTGNLPEGFIFTEDGVLSGIPSEEGTYSFDITAENSQGSATKTFTLILKPEKPQITTLMLPYGIVDEPYSFMLDSEGESLTWSKTGNFPDGLKLDRNTGEISGTPLTAGTYTFTVKAKNSTGTSTVPLQIVVASEEGTFDASDEDAELPEVYASDNIELYFLSGDEERSGTIRVTAGMPLKFRAGESGSDDDAEGTAEISGAKVFMNDKAAERISVAADGTFTIPGELVRGSFTVYVSGVSDGLAVETNDINVTASEAAREEQGNPADGGNNNNSSQQGGHADSSAGEEQYNSNDENLIQDDSSGSSRNENTTEGRRSDNSSGSNSQEIQYGGEGQGDSSGGSGGCSVNFAGIFMLLMSGAVLLKKK